MIMEYSGYRALRRRIKDNLSKSAYRHLGLHLSELNHPLFMIEYLGLKCRGIIHVGANAGDEFYSYRNADLECAVYIEPIPEIFIALRERVSIDPRHHAIQALCSDRTGEEIEFNVASNAGQSSSMLEMARHAEEHPEVTYSSRIKLQTTTLDQIIFHTPNIISSALDCLVMDVQGAEMRVIRGAPRTLAGCKFVFTEISEGGLYSGDVPFEDVIAALKQCGFALKALEVNKHGWGNAFLVKSSGGPARLK